MSLITMCRPLFTTVFGMVAVVLSTLAFAWLPIQTAVADDDDEASR